MTPAAETHYTERMRQLLHVPVTRLGVAEDLLVIELLPPGRWGEWYAKQRLVPYLRTASTAGPRRARGPSPNHQ